MDLKQYLTSFKENIEVVADELSNTIKEYHKTAGTSGFVIGMSGGLDCAVVSALCKRADVPLTAITMPYEAENSPQRKLGMQHAKEMCDKFDIPLLTIDITKTVHSIYDGLNLEKLGHTLGNISLSNKSDKPQSFHKLLEFAGDVSMSKANVLPRIRMTNLYYIAQGLNALVLGTGNLSEITMAYFTKWGDGACDFNPVKQLTKSEMYILAEYLGVPESICKKAPSADLWDAQTDESEMGLSYAMIDQYILLGEGTPKTIEKIESTKAKNKHKMSFVLYPEKRT